MRTPPIGLTILAIILFVVAASAGDVAEDKKTIQGTWSIVYAVFEGKQVPAAEIKKAEIVIAAEKLTLREKGKEGNVWQYTLDPSKKPKTIDVIVKTFKLRPGGEAVELLMEKMVGIYDLKGDDLRIALSKGISLKKDAKDQIEADKSVVRPSSFEHGPNVAGVLILRRTAK